MPIAGRQGPGPGAGYVTVGEGFSSQAPAEGIEVAVRMFSVPELPEICSKARADEVVRLRSQLPRLRLRVGEPFVRARLKIVALDASGAVLPRVPIAVDVDGPPKRALIAPPPAALQRLVSRPRTRLSLDKDAPVPLVVQPACGLIVPVPHVGGLHYHERPTV